MKIELSTVQVIEIFFWGEGGLVNDDVTLEGVHQMITLNYGGKGGV